MAKTKKDKATWDRITKLIPMLETQGQKKNEIIYSIAGLCSISHRTASQHYKTFKAQKTLSELGITAEEACSHEFVTGTSAGGLFKECVHCGKVKEIKL